MRTPLDVHTVYTHVCICTHTFAHTHTHTSIQDTNPPIHITFKRKRTKREREKKRAKEESDTKRASARDIKESTTPRTLFLASTVAPACSSASTVDLCPFMADRKRGVRPRCRIVGVRGESGRCAQGAHTYKHTHGRVPGCVCVNQYMHVHAHTPRCAHCVHMCVYIHTHVYTCVCMYTCVHICLCTHVCVCTLK
jgi:hypothetical protein